MNSQTNKNYAPDLTDLELKRYQLMLEDGNSKSGKLFRLLRDHKGQWIPLPTIGAHIKTRSVNGHISRLRQIGCVIDNQWELEQEGSTWGETRACKSWYRLRKEPQDFLNEREATAKANLL